MRGEAPHDDVIQVHLGRIGLEGCLRLPEGSRGLVQFAHGSGSGRLSPRNNHVARGLAEVRLATLLFDLLTEEESADRANVFDIELLAGRLSMAMRWAREHEALRSLPIGCFGASTGAAAALVAAARAPGDIAAVVSRGGRPDLAAPVLAVVRAPTLLIVGGCDRQVLELNRQALAELRCTKDLRIVPGAGHLFEEPGALDQVVELARDWLAHHLTAGRERRAP